MLSTRGLLCWLCKRAGILFATLLLIDAAYPLASSVQAKGKDEVCTYGANSSDSIPCSNFWKDPGEPERLEKRRQLLDSLFDKLSNGSGALLKRWTKFQYGYPYTPFFDYTKTIGEDWYVFGLTAGGGYQALASADALQGNLQIGASVSAGTSVILLSKTLPVLDGIIGAGNYMQSWSIGGDLPPDTDKWKKWLPKVKAEVKLFGISIWSKQAPSTNKSEAEAKALDEAVKSAVKQRAGEVQDEFTQYMNAVQTQIGQGSSTAGVTAGPSTKPESKVPLQKQLLDYKKSCKDYFGSAIIIPIVPPLNIEINFGVFFSHSLMFEFGISGGGLSVNVSSNLASDPQTNWLQQATSSLKSSQLVSSVSSIMTGDLSGSDLSLLNLTDAGMDDLAAIEDKVASGVAGALDSEIKGSVRILPAISAGAWVTAAAVLDLVVASAAAGVKGTLKLVEAKAGGGITFSSASDYADMVAMGTLNLFSGSIELFASVEFLAGIIPPIQWSQVIFTFPGLTYDFSFPIARLAYRDAGSPRVFLCIGSSFKRIEHTYQATGVNECDLSVKFVPSESTSLISKNIQDLVRAHEIDPPKPNPCENNCVITINSNSILATPGAATASTCADYINVDAKRSEMVDLAKGRYPEKFISNLYDGANPVILLEAYYNCSVQAQKYEDVSHYPLDSWAQLYDSDQAARQSGMQPPPYAPLPQEEPALTLPGGKGLTKVREIGWEPDELALLEYSDKHLTGFCRAVATPSDANCEYKVKALGVGFPDGKGCVSKDWNILQRFAAQYDCAPKNSTGAAAKVAACLLRSAFAQGLCYPPAKAEYIIQLVDALKTMPAIDLFNKLAPYEYFSNDDGSANHPTCSGNFGVAANRTPGSNCGLLGKNYGGTNLGIFRGPDITIPPTGWDAVTPTPIPQGASDTYTYKNMSTLGHCGGTTGLVAAGSFFTKSSISATNKDIIGSDFKEHLYDGVCEIALNLPSSTTTAPDEEYQQKPQTCQLMAFVSNAQNIVDEFFKTDGTSISTRYECKSAYSGNLDQLCRTVKTKAGIVSSATIPLYTLFQGDQMDPIATCEVDANGNTTAIEAGPAAASATTATTSTVADSCEVLVGNKSASKLFVSQVLRGLTVDGFEKPDGTLDYNKAAQTCIQMITPRDPSAPLSAVTALTMSSKSGTAVTNPYCPRIDATVTRALRGTAGLSLGAVEIWVRVNSKNTSGNTVLGSLVQMPGTCDLAVPPAEPGCDLLAKSPSKSYSIRVARANQKTKTDCENAFKPYSVLCEQLPNFPEIRKENAAASGCNVSTTVGCPFANGQSIPLTVRFTPATGAATTTQIASCTYGTAANNNTLCELLVTLPNGFAINMNGTDQLQSPQNITWKTVNLSSNSVLSADALIGCKNRFLGYVGGQLKVDPTCYGLSAQIRKASAPNVPGLKGTPGLVTFDKDGKSAQLPDTPITVNLTARYRSPANATTAAASTSALGSCSYDSKGQSTLFQLASTLPSLKPTKEEIATGLQTGSGGSLAPEVTDLTFDPGNGGAITPDKFYLKVRYLGAKPPMVPDKYLIKAPSISMGTDGKVLVSASSMTPLPGTNPDGTTFPLNPLLVAASKVLEKDKFVTLGPFDSSFIGGGNCKTLKVKLAASFAYPTTGVKIAATERIFEKSITTPCVPLIEIAKINVTSPESGTPTTFTVTYKNVGGTVASSAPAAQKQFQLKIENAANAANFVQPTYSIPTAGASVTTPVPAFNLGTFAGANYCTSATKGVPNPKEFIGTLLLTPSVAALGYKFQAPIKILCGPNLALTNIAYKPSSFNTITMDYLNSGANPAATPTGNDKFTLTVTPATTFLATPVVGLASYAIPANGMLPLLPAEITLPSGQTCGQAVSMKFTANRVSSGEVLAEVTKDLTPLCPPAPKIEIPSVTVASASESGAPATITVAYQNVGPAFAVNAPTSHKKFQITVKDKSTGKTIESALLDTPAPTTSTGTGLPATSATKTTNFDLAGIAKTNYCTSGLKTYVTDLEVTTSLSAANYVRKETITVLCGVNLEISSIAFKAGTNNVVTVGYKNLGATATVSPLTFDLKLTSATTATPPASYAADVPKTGLSIPNNNASGTPWDFTLNTSGACGAPVNFTATATRGSGTAIATLATKAVSLTQPCPSPRHDLRTVQSGVYVSADYTNIQVLWGLASITTNASDNCTGKTFKVKVSNFDDPTKSCTSAVVACTLSCAGASCPVSVKMTGCTGTQLGLVEGKKIKVSINFEDTMYEVNKTNNTCTALIGPAVNSTTVPQNVTVTTTGGSTSYSISGFLPYSRAGNCVPPL